MHSPTNAILTGLAVADLLVMLDYVPYAIIANLLPLFDVSRERRLAYSATWFVMAHSIFAQIFHTISIWLTVTLAVWRYIAVAYPQKNRLWCGMRKTLWAIASSYVVCPFIGIPLYLSVSITPSVIVTDDRGATENVTIYRVAYSELGASGTMHLVNLWIYSVAIKLIPCVALTVLSQRLIAALVEAKRRRKMLTSNAPYAMKQLTNGKAMEKSKGSKNMDKERQTDRTTRMLVAVLMLFLITEFPQGILGLLSALLENSFYMNCYLKLGEYILDGSVCSICGVTHTTVLLLGDFLDLLALLNSAINFILYCSMSRQFRMTFAKLFWPKCIDRWLPVNQHDDDANGCRTDAGGKADANGGQTTTQVTQV